MRPTSRNVSASVIIAALCCLAAVNGAEPTPTPLPTHSPSPTTSASQPDPRWKQINFYRDGQKAYSEKKYAEAFKQLVQFKAANQEVFAAPPDDLKPVVKEISDAIAYSETQLAKKPAAGTGPASSPNRPDGVHRGDHPGMSAEMGGRLSGAHDGNSAGASKRESGASSSGASARERP